MQTTLVSKYHQTSKILKDNLVVLTACTKNLLVFFLLQPQVNDKDVMSGYFFLTVTFKKSRVLDFLIDRRIHTDTEPAQHSQHQTYIQAAKNVKQQNERGDICLHLTGGSHCCFLLSWQSDGGFITLGQ